MNNILYPVYHKIPLSCGNVGLYTTAKNKKAGDLVLSSEFFSMTGDPCNNGDVVICGACGELMQIMVSNIDYDNPVDLKTLKKNIING